MSFLTCVERAKEKKKGRPKNGGMSMSTHNSSVTSLLHPTCHVDPCPKWG